MSDVPDFRQMYDRALALLNETIEASDRHVRTMPHCPGLPLCIGGKNITMLYRAVAADASTPYTMIMVAVHELSAARKQIAALQDEVEALSRRQLDDTIRKLLDTD